VKPLAPLNRVRHCLLRWGGGEVVDYLRLSTTTQITRNSNMIIVTIAATRLYRSLTNIYSSDMSGISSQSFLDNTDDRSSSLKSPRGTGRSVSELRVQPGTIPLNRMEVSVRTKYDQFSSRSRSGTCISTDPQGRYKTHEMSLKVDVESGQEEKQ
jgi:hypothetical protein